MLSCANVAETGAGSELDHPRFQTMPPGKNPSPSKSRTSKTAVGAVQPNHMRVRVCSEYWHKSRNPPATGSPSPHKSPAASAAVELSAPLR